MGARLTGSCAESTWLSVVASSDGVHFGFPGVVPCAVLLRTLVAHALPDGFDWDTGMMLGARLTTSDSVSVLAEIKEVGGSPRLTTVIKDEVISNLCSCPLCVDRADPEIVQGGDGRRSDDL